MHVLNVPPGYAFDDWEAAGHVFTVRCTGTGTAEIQRLTRAPFPSKIARLVFDESGTITAYEPAPDTGDLASRLRGDAETILTRAAKE